MQTDLSFETMFKKKKEKHYLPEHDRNKDLSFHYVTSMGKWLQL